LSNWSKPWWEVKLMVVVLGLEWNRLLDMYKSVYLVATIRKSFLFGDKEWEPGLRKMFLKKVD
jgi:hypothetical protein